MPNYFRMHNCGLSLVKLQLKMYSLPVFPGEKP